MIDPHSLLGRHVHLMQDVVYDSVKDYPTFTFLSCKKYPEPWYNLIVPTVDLDSLDIHGILELHTLLRQNSIEAGIYIAEENVDTFGELEEMHDFASMADDTFLSRLVHNNLRPIKNTIISLSDEYLQEYLVAAKVCFRDWPNNQEWSEYFCDLMKINPFKNKEFHTFVGMKDDKVVSYGSIVLDLDVGLGYLHNAGTLEEYRRLGFHSDLVSARCEFALKHGVQQVVSITEEGNNSYKSLKKLGFESTEKYHIYTLRE